MSVYDVDGSRLDFNVERVGGSSVGADYFYLRGAQYGPEGNGFREPTFGELAPLVHAALGTKDTNEAKRVIETLEGCGMAGKTMAITGREGLFADDNPDLKLIDLSYQERVKDGLQQYEDFLKNRLGRREENGVVYSDDGIVRFTPYGFKLGTQSKLHFSKNRGLIVLVGNIERADMLAEASRHYTLKPSLISEFGETDTLQLRMPGVRRGDFFSDDLFVDCDGRSGCDSGRGSFGIRKSAEGTH